MTRRMYDAAYPPSHPPAWEAVAAYIGGDTPHVWTIAEWNAQPARWRLPIFVRSNPTIARAVPDSAATIAWLQAHKVPRGSAVALDLETAVHVAYVRAFDAALVAAGYKVLAYGSLSTVFENPRTSGGYWVAHYTGTAHMESGAVATQWANDRQLGKPWDANTVADSVPLWDTHPAPQPPPPPQQETEMIARDVLVGLDAKTQFPLDGKETKLVAFADNTFTNAHVKATAPVQLRVRVLHTDGTWQAWEPVVGRAAGEAATKCFVSVAIADPTHALAVTVTRLTGDGTEPVTVGAC